MYRIYFNLEYFGKYDHLFYFIASKLCNDSKKGSKRSVCDAKGWNFMLDTEMQIAAVPARILNLT